MIPPHLPGVLLRAVALAFGGDLVRWAWARLEREATRAADDEHRATCSWCGTSVVVTRTPAEGPPASDEPPDGWYADDGRAGYRPWWCSLRCHVEHWRADRRVEPPPVLEALDAHGAADD